jgi:hypothetical protein
MRIFYPVVQLLVAVTVNANDDSPLESRDRYQTPPHHNT